MAYNEITYRTKEHIVIRREDIFDDSSNVLESLQKEISKPNNLMIKKSFKVKKHRCPNCGATKIESNDCEYCGT